MPNQPQSYVVTFPDGRQETFGYVATDPYYRATPGVRERLQPWTSTNPPNGEFGYCYLVLPDGGKVEFYGTRTPEYCFDCIPQYSYEYDLTPTALIDPYGQRITYTNPGDGSFTITEPAGRWIKVFSDYIQASDGREVHYTWQTQHFGIPSLPYVVLTSVDYYGDPSLTSTYTYQIGNVGKHGCALATCDDPMYAGPMKKITYVYNSSGNQDGSWPVEGQIYSEKSIAGDSVTTLTVIDQNTRRETRADGRQRTFTYSTDGYLTSWTDFKNVPSSQTYDSNKFVNSITDGRYNTTNFTNNPLTGVVTQVEYPSTPGDTPPGTPTGKVKYSYGGGVGCLDPNNQDANNPYYVCVATDEAGNVTRFSRDTNKRVTRIDYPDGGYETLSYNGFGEVLEHRLKTGGIESFTYDATTGLRQTYRSPDNAIGNPTACYGYDSLDRLSGVTDVFGSYPGEPYHTTNYQYNSRGQLTVTTLPLDPVDFTRHTITNTYNSNGDGTLVQVTDQLNHVTTYTYDDYRRPRSVTTSTARTTYFSYDHTQGTADDYTHSDSNVTRVTLPSGNIVKTIYDENYRKTDVIACSGSGTDVARTSYGYDPAGNQTSMVLPDEQDGGAHPGLSTIWEYDERNRLMSVKNPLNGPMNHFTSFKYDAGGRKKTVTQPNGQVITYDEYDSMNRLLQQTVQQTSQMNAVTQYTYEPATGLHMTMKDPHLFEISSSDVYTFEYDVMGRAKTLTYPHDSLGVQRSESYTYDATGRLGTYTNRDGKVQTFSYDNLHRQTGFTWSAGANTPNVSVGYDAANRAISISNSNAVISRTYFDDNLLHTETETPAGGTANTVSYTWAADGQLGTLTYPSGNSYLYKYTGRGQLKQVQQNMLPLYYQAEYVYDVNGNLATRRVGVNQASFSVTTDSSQRDVLGRCTRLTHQFPSGSGGTRFFDYLFDVMGNRIWIARDDQAGDSYDYDIAQQVKEGVDGGNAHTYAYDANGNRTTLDGGGSYTANNLNQQTTFNGLAVGYGDANGNVTSSSVGGSSSYIYDAQNRLTSATVDGTTTTFAYDGLNRKVSQTVQGIGGTTTYNVWSGWNLIEERGAGNTLLNTYVYGAGEIIERINGTGTYFYYQDGQGSTSHLADATGALQEVYKYSTFGQPSVFAPSGSVRKGGSSYDVRHLFTGQLWMPQAGLYDYRNRVFSPALTRFLQPDPIGFAGDPSNLYRYCGNNSVNRMDPSGMGERTRHGGKPPPQKRKDGNDGIPGGEMYAVRDDGRIYNPYGGMELEIDPFGNSDRVVMEIPMGPAIGPWGEHSAGPGDFGPGDHGSAGGLSGGSSGPIGGSPNTSGPSYSGPYSGSRTVEWWPQWLTLPYTAPPTREQAAWTQSGFYPTLIVGGIIFAPVIIPEIAAAGPAAVQAFRWAYTHPATISAVSYGVVIAQGSLNPEEQLLLPEIIEEEQVLVEWWMHRW